MSNPLMTPDTAWVLGSVLGAVVTTGPAYLLAIRRSGHQEHREHQATRQATVDALNAVVGPLNGRLDEMHATIADMRDWQANHALQHKTSDIKHSILEVRKGN